MESDCPELKEFWELHVEGFHQEPAVDSTTDLDAARVASSSSAAAAAAAAGSANRRATTNMHWDHEEILALIQVWSERHIQKELRGSIRNARAFTKIAERLTQVGFSRTAQQCRDKVKKMKQEYRKITKPSTAATSAALLRHRFRYFDMVERIMLMATLEVEESTGAASTPTSDDEQSATDVEAKQSAMNSVCDVTAAACNLDGLKNYRRPTGQKRRHEFQESLLSYLSEMQKNYLDFEKEMHRQEMEAETRRRQDERQHEIRLLEIVAKMTGKLLTGIDAPQLPSSDRPQPSPIKRAKI